MKDIIVDITARKLPPRSLVGGKGFSLCKLANSGFAVPTGFILTTRAFDIYSKWQYRNSPKKKKAIDKIKSAITGRLDVLQLKEKRLVIRSSANVEDSLTTSFAGQFKTIINVKGLKGVMSAIESIYSSTFSDKVENYSSSLGINLRKMKMAIVVQELIPGDVSGVMFTANPTSNDDMLMVEAVVGLNEGLVSGALTPSRFLIDRRGKKIKNKIISNQKYSVVLSESGTRVAPNRHKITKLLSRNTLTDLAKYGIKIERLFQRPQDIEWTVCKGKIYFLQSRPITLTRFSFPVKTTKKGRRLIGFPGASGVAEGTAMKITSPKDAVVPGFVLVFESTNTDYMPIIKQAKALVTQEGGVLSHAAIVARELGIPCVVGVQGVMSAVKNNDVLLVNGNEGVVVVNPTERTTFIAKPKKFDEASFFCMDTMRPMKFKNANAFYEIFDDELVYYNKKQINALILRKVLGDKIVSGKLIRRGDKTKYSIKVGYDNYAKDRLLRKLFSSSIRAVSSFKTEKAKMAIEHIVKFSRNQISLAKKNPNSMEYRDLLSRLLAEGRAKRAYLLLNTLICEGYALRTMYGRTKRLAAKLNTDFPALLSQAQKGPDAGFISRLTHAERKTFSEFVEYYRIIRFWREKSYPLFVEMGATGDVFNRNHELLARKLNSITGKTFSSNEWFLKAMAEENETA